MGGAAAWREEKTEWPRAARFASTKTTLYRKLRYARSPITDIFLYIQHNYEAYTHSLTTSLLSYYRIRLSSRDSNVFKWRPRSSRMASQSVCVSLLLYSLSSAFSLIRLSTRRVVWNRCPRHVSHFIVSESSLTLCRAYLLYPPISRKTFPLAAAI